MTNHIARDSKGFLWFCARGGLSRFDGYEFTSYRLGDEKASLLVHYFLEAHDGTYWIATDTGLFRVKPKEQFEALPAKFELPQGERRLTAEKVTNQSFWTLAEDQKGNLWGGSSKFYLIENKEAAKVSLTEIDFDPAATKEKPSMVRDLTIASDGSVWGVFSSGVVRVLPDGRLFSYQVPQLSEIQDSYNIFEDTAGKIWFSHSSGLFILKPDKIDELVNQPDKSIFQLKIEEQKLDISGKVSYPTQSKQTLKLSFTGNEQSGKFGVNQQTSPELQDIYQISNGKIWLPVKDSLYVFDGDNYSRLTDSNSLSGQVRRMVEDLSGNIWFGSFSGVSKYNQGGLISYNRTGGLKEPTVYLIRDNPDGDLLVIHGQFRVSRLTEKSFESAELNLPPNTRFNWTSMPVFADKIGNLWALTLNGLYRFPYQKSFPAQTSQTPQLISVPEIVSKESKLYRAFSDKNGNIWFSILFANDNRLLKFDINTGNWTDFTKKEGYPKGYAVASFAEDKSGNIWLGFYSYGGLFKFANDRFTEITLADGLTGGSVFGLLIDQKERLWIGSTSKGLVRVDDPTAEKLKFVSYAENEELANANIRCLAEDNFGNIYAGTVRGVSRINPETGKVRQFTTNDGLAADFVHTAFRDMNGTMWFGTTNGLSKLEPTIENESPNPSIYISDLKIAGENYDISELGQKRIETIELAVEQNNLQIKFFGIGQAKDLRYQYKLEGATGDWSQPSKQRTVNFANLSSGSYRFSVRSVNDIGDTSEIPAIISFKINPPFYRSWWFLTLVFLLVGGAIFVVVRYRVAKTKQIQAALEALNKSRAERIAELQKVRSRIATDLHDDIGSSLTQISVYSEIARQRESENGDASESLNLITNVANELVDTMSDIVWAINPKKDHLQDLTQRMRRFAANGLSAKDIEMNFIAPDSEKDIPLGANIRREVFLIFKETVNNIVKHSEAKNAEIMFKLENRLLEITFKDDGLGFDQKLSKSGQKDWKQFRGGNGLLNMKKRAEDLGGNYEIETKIGNGTSVIFRIPIDVNEGVSSADKRG